MRNLRSKAKKSLGSALAVASLALAVPAAMAGTAHADPNTPNVKLFGNTSCTRFGTSIPVSVRVASGELGMNTTIPVANFGAQTATVNVPVTGVPPDRAVNVEITLVCDSPAGRNEIPRNFAVARPPFGELQSFSIS